MYWDPEVIIVDETTTALSYKGRQLIYKIIRELAAAGKAVLFISHDLEELIEFCTVMTILRDGQLIGRLEKDAFNQKHIKEMMVGREINDHYYRNDMDQYDEGQDNELWQKTCKSAGIPAWGVPRLFVDDKSYAGWFEMDGELLYANEYYGYIGYRNQIIAALRQHCQNLIVPEDTAQQSTNDHDTVQVVDDDCGC